MSASPPNAEDHIDSNQHVLSPERRLHAAAEIIARGLARVLLAENQGGSVDDARPAKHTENTPENALIHAPCGALMDERGEQACA